jgi:hypothetical protein
LSLPKLTWQPKLTIHDHFLGFLFDTVVQQNFIIPYTLFRAIMGYLLRQVFGGVFRIIAILVLINKFTNPLHCNTPNSVVVTFWESQEGIIRNSWECQATIVVAMGLFTRTVNAKLSIMLLCLQKGVTAKLCVKV